MSSFIVDRIEAVRFPKEAIDHYADKFLVLQLGGCSNCFESHTGRRARDWVACYFGMEWEVVGQCCRSASDCAGGMLRFSKSSNCTPESYIRAHRKALKDAAIGIDGARQRRLSITARIRFPLSEIEDYYCQELTKWRLPEHEESYGDKYLVFRFDLDHPHDLKMWTKYAPSKAWNSAEVRGPRD